MQVLYRLRSVVERLGLRRESATTLLEHVRSELADAETDAGDPTVEVADLERRALEASGAARVAAVEREARAERARQVLARLLAAERSLHDAAQVQLDELLAGRATIEEELTGAAGERESALSVSYELRSRAARARRSRGTRLASRARRARPAPACRRATRGREVRAAPVGRSRGDARGVRLRPAARRAVVRRRDRRGGPARARGTPRGACDRGKGARRAGTAGRAGCVGRGRAGGAGRRGVRSRRTAIAHPPR